MDEEQANTVAEALGGSSWQSGGNIWLVLFERTDGKVVVISDEVVCEYGNMNAFEYARSIASIVLH